MNQPQEIQVPGVPAPAQTAVVGPHNTPDGRLVVLMVKSVNGEFAFFLDAHHCKTLAAQLEQHAVQAETGLILPPPNGLAP